MTVGKSQLRHVMGHYPTGVAVVTALGENGPAGNDLQLLHLGLA